MKVEPVSLSNHVVSLSPLREAHRAALARAANDPALWRYHSQNQYARTFDAWFDLSLRHADTGEGLTFVVSDAGTGEIVGSSSYLAISLPNRRLEIGSTWYTRAAQGTRINPATKLLLMDHGFGPLDLGRIEFKLDARNARSRAAMRKLGAHEEGTFRRHILLPDGHLRDSVWFSVIAEEWPRVRAGLIARVGTG